MTTSTISALKLETFPNANYPSALRKLKPELKVLILNQAFYPDVVATAQHASELAAALSERGHNVTAVSSTRCYDKPEIQYPAQEQWDGVNICRVWSSGFGKKSKWSRAADFGSFILSCAWKLLWLERQDVVVALTSPPLISFLAALLTRLRGGRLVFWVMDLNPDEAVAAGWLNPKSKVARLLQMMLSFSIHRAGRIIALDRFMAARLAAKGADANKVAVLPPWSHSHEVFFDQQGRDRFRAAHALEGKFVVMYSGNHSPCHPLATLLEAARELRDRKDLAFCFVGGGSEHRKVRNYAEQHALENIVVLPYEPLSQLSGSLSAADLHVVVMGNPFVGMIHPCKIYNVLSLGTPVLYIGPEQSHIGDMTFAGNARAWLYESRHEDVPALVANILTAQRQKVLRIQPAIQFSSRFSVDALLGSHIDVIEQAALDGACQASSFGRREPQNFSQNRNLTEGL